jgi:hypothetical protein
MTKSIFSLAVLICSLSMALAKEESKAINPSFKKVVENIKNSPQFYSQEASSIHRKFGTLNMHEYSMPSSMGSAPPPYQSGPGGGSQYSMPSSMGSAPPPYQSGPGGSYQSGPMSGGSGGMSGGSYQSGPGGSYQSGPMSGGSGGMSGGSYQSGPDDGMSGGSGGGSGGMDWSNNHGGSGGMDWSNNFGGSGGMDGSHDFGGSGGMEWPIYDHEYIVVHHGPTLKNPNPWPALSFVNFEGPEIVSRVSFKINACIPGYLGFHDENKDMDMLFDDNGNVKFFSSTTGICNILQHQGNVVGAEKDAFTAFEKPIEVLKEEKVTELFLSHINKYNKSI